MKRDYRAFQRGMRVACKIELGVVGVVTRVARNVSWVDVLWEVPGAIWSKRMKPHVLVEVGAGRPPGDPTP